MANPCRARSLLHRELGGCWAGGFLSPQPSLESIPRRAPILGRGEQRGHSSTGSHHSSCELVTLGCLGPSTDLRLCESSLSPALLPPAEQESVWDLSFKTCFSSASQNRRNKPTKTPQKYKNPLSKYLCISTFAPVLQHPGGCVRRYVRHTQTDTQTRACSCTIAK